MDPSEEARVGQCKASIAELTQQILEQEKQLERLHHKCLMVESENKTLESLIGRRQTELDKLLIEKEQLFLRAQELDRGSAPREKPAEPAPTAVSALMNYFSQKEAEEVKQEELPEQEEGQQMFIEDDVDITDELQKLGLIDVVKKY